MTTARATRDLPLTGSAIALATIGTLAVAQAPAFQNGFAVIFVLVALARLTVGRDGRRLLPLALIQAIGFSLAAISLAYVLHRLGTRSYVDGPNALWALMEITCLFEALVLLWRQRAFSSFLLILFSSVHATGIAFAVPESIGLVFVGAYVIVLAWTLVVFERGAALETETDGDGAVLRVRAKTKTPLPWQTALRTTGVLLLFGLPLGTLLYVAAPRNWELPGNLGSRASREPLNHDGSIRMTEDTAGAMEGAVIGTTGPGEGGAPLGSVAEIKKDITPIFEVSLEGADRMPPTVVLREIVEDTYLTFGKWESVLDKQVRARIHRDYDDNRPDGWIPLEHHGRDGTETTIRIEMLRGGNQRIFHQPFETAVKIRRDGRILAPAEVVETADEGLRARVPLKAGDIILQRYVPQPNRMDPSLFGRRSDPAVSPQTTYLQVPGAVRGPMLSVARRIVGDEKDPWRRALLLEGWLKSPEFTYTLKMPRLDKSNPAVDFLVRTKSGHCECFAYALTLMLRSLGHPARHAQGYWDGDRLEERKTVLIRNSHYHAWTEIYLDGVGWLALNPTPPERRAADAGSITAAEGPSLDADEEVDDAWSFDFLGLDDEGWRGFWKSVGKGADDWILSPLAALFDGRTGWIGIWGTCLVLLFAHRRRRTARIQRLVVAPGRSLPGGAYGRALMALARKGVRRPASWTVAEFASFVGKRFPDAAAPFAALSSAHEATRYGGKDAEGARTGEQLDALKRALARKDNA